MPIFEYRCKSCGTVTEFLVGIGKDTAIMCSHCGSLDIKKIISAASFLEGGLNRTPGNTCCGREERCDTPPCYTGGGCRRDEP